MDVQAWWSGGELVPLELSGTEQGVFVRREGSGPSMTLLHGFPSSSHDWAKIAPALAERYALTMPDLLGFGASTKPREHRYSLLEQADLVEALWASEGIESTVVVAHDYSVSVAQELLTRRAAGALAVDLRALPLHERRPLPGSAPAPARAGGPALAHDPLRRPRLKASARRPLAAESRAMEVNRPVVWLLIVAREPQEPQLGHSEAAREHGPGNLLQPTINPEA